SSPPGYGPVRHDGRRAESQLATTSCEAGALGWSMKLWPAPGTTQEVLSAAAAKSGSSSGSGGKSTSCSAMISSTGTWMRGTAVRDGCEEMVRISPDGVSCASCVSFATTVGSAQVRSYMNMARVLGSPPK